ncbi:UDP-N-acetylglucosamine--N-acetylmuramyl-(pentapeptide) pyrophosphoryl-undecaprenol N-acetylglucosamine transferase [Patescibacteria group bacterium]|nr:UDP-N-acetylglucosamine--N-acetylmuramyl-(pentapeptide) pyrophosphoryl-undecaprenol N-acetylglucosamine transferase [Patescibacteria group bacterium]
MRIMFVGGGTGGHFYPLLAVAEALRARTDGRVRELYYIGPTPYEPDELARLDIRFVSCPAGKQRRYFSFQNFIDPFKVVFGFFVALVKLYVIYPDVIFSKGSFTSVPVLYAARILRIPVVIHESDAIAGRANLLAKKFARHIAIAYPEAAQYFPKDKTALVGIPIRAALRTPPVDAHAYLGIPQDLPLLVVTGGSLGAEYINNLLLRSLPTLLQEYRIFHLAGTSHFDEIKLTAKTLVTDTTLRSRYYLQPSVPAPVMAALLSAATLVISRSGSSSIHELAFYGKPAILIPIPESVSRDQRTNAFAYARSGAASVLEQDNLTEHLLTAEIKTIIGDPTRYESMAKAAKGFALPGAAEQVANLVTSIGVEHGS